MALFGEWGDKDTINALVGLLVSGLPAIGYLIVRVLRSKGEYDKVQADIVDRSETRTNTELTRMLEAAMARVKQLEDDLREQDRRYERAQERAQARFEQCASERAAHVETIAWQKRLLQQHGILSDDEGRTITPAGVPIPKKPKATPGQPESGS